MRAISSSQTFDGVVESWGFAVVFVNGYEVVDCDEIVEARVVIRVPKYNIRKQ